jgi:hypothetical protein
VKKFFVSAIYLQILEIVDAAAVRRCSLEETATRHNMVCPHIMPLILPTLPAIITNSAAFLWWFLLPDQHGLLAAASPHGGAHYLLENVQGAHFHRR